MKWHEQHLTCVFDEVCACARAHFVYAYGCVSVSILLLRSSTSPLSATFSHLLATKMEKNPQKTKTKPGLFKFHTLSEVDRTGFSWWLFITVDDIMGFSVEMK